MVKICRRLKLQVARILGDHRSPLRSPEAPPAYNAAAVEIMQANAIRVNDLFGLGTSLAHTQMPRNVDYTAAGLTALGEVVAQVIDSELKARGKQPAGSDLR